MAIKDQIDKILVKRQKKAEELRERQALLRKIRNDLASFRGLYSEAWGIPDDELRSQYSDCFARLSDMANVGTADAPVTLEEEIEAAVRRLEEGIREFPDSTDLRITFLKDLLEASGQDRELCLQTIERFLKECPKLAGEEEFQKLMREYGINVEGGKVWAEKADP